jgi:hypothetical protein
MESPSGHRALDVLHDPGISTSVPSEMTSTSRFLAHEYWSTRRGFNLAGEDDLHVGAHILVSLWAMTMFWPPMT